MKKARISESEIITVLKEVESSAPIKELYSKHSIKDASFYILRKKFGGTASDLKRLRHPKEENRRLKHIYSRLGKSVFAWNNKHVYRVYYMLKLNRRKRPKKRLPSRKKTAFSATDPAKYLLVVTGLYQRCPYECMTISHNQCH